MYKSNFIYVLILISSTLSFSQDNVEKEKQQGHVNVNKFRQLYEEFSSPNMFRTASGAPGPAYYQQQADYVMEIELDEKNKMIYGNETFIYNNSPDILDYLWFKGSKCQKKILLLKIDGNGLRSLYRPSEFKSEFVDDPFDGGFNIDRIGSK